MATPPESPVEEVVYELETTRTPKPIPVALEDLCRQTKFTRQEIRVMYRGFKTVCITLLGDVGCLVKRLVDTHLNVLCISRRKMQECPEGVVLEDSFKDIYAKFFPHGSKCDTKLIALQVLFAQSWS